MGFNISKRVWKWVGILLAVLWIYYIIFYKVWFTSRPNEWLLVVRNGKMIKGNIGISTIALPWDQIIKFPSLIN